MISGAEQGEILGAGKTTRMPVVERVLKRYAFVIVQYVRVQIRYEGCVFLNGSNWRYGVYSNLSGWSDPMHLDDSGDYQD